MTAPQKPNAHSKSAPPPYPAETLGMNFFDSDKSLQRLLERIDPALLARQRAMLSDLGQWTAGPLEEAARYSDRYAPPRLETFNKLGQKKSHVIFNPRYEAVHNEAYTRGTIGLAFDEKNPEPHLLTFAMGYMLAQADISVYCPVTMTGAVAYVLDKFAPKHIRDEYLHQLTRMDGKHLSGGTWATELHGGSDVGATTTRAVKDPDGKVRLYGLKWFTSNANSGLALATARPEGAPAGNKGLGLYLVPSHLKDGAQNGYTIRRLKDKMGTKGLATGEIDLEGAEVIEVAAPPHGLKMMMEALEYSRVHNAVGAAGVQRRAFLEAASWATHRMAFGKNIVEYPMVQQTLTHLMVTAEAGAALAFESARAFDVALKDPAQNSWLRLATALAKYRTGEDAVQCAKTALETVGGNGYTEEFPTARLLRDSMVLTVWEGPANIQALEVLRMVAGREPGDKMFIDHIRAIADALPPMLAHEKTLLETGLQQAQTALAHLRQNPAEGDIHARHLMDHLADVLTGALLCQAAADDLALGDARKALIARHYLERAFAQKAFALRGAAPLAKNFRAAFAYEKISPATAGYAPDPANPKRCQKPPQP